MCETGLNGWVNEWATGGDWEASGVKPMQSQNQHCKVLWIMYSRKSDVKDETHINTDWQGVCENEREREREQKNWQLKAWAQRGSSALRHDFVEIWWWWWQRWYKNVNKNSEKREIAKLNDDDVGRTLQNYPKVLCTFTVFHFSKDSAAYATEKHFYTLVTRTQSQLLYD